MYESVDEEPTLHALSSIRERETSVEKAKYLFALEDAKMDSTLTRNPGAHFNRLAFNPVTGQRPLKPLKDEFIIQSIPNNDSTLQEYHSNMIAFFKP